MIGPFFSPENLISFGGTPQPKPNLPTGVTPITPQPQSNLPIMGMTGVVSTTPQEKLNPMAGAKNDKLALMLYALGGALKGDKNFMQNTLQLQQMQEGKKKQKELEENWKKALEKIKKEKIINPTLISLAELLPPEQGTRLVAGGIPEIGQDKKTAAMINLEAFNKIKAEGTPEQIAIAERVLIGTRQNKSEEQMKKELIASLLRQTDPLGDPISEEEINNRLQLFDTLVGKTPTPIPNDDQLLNYQGYSVKRVE